MTKADNFGIFPLVGHYQCSGLELGSIIGYFDRYAAYIAWMSIKRLREVVPHQTYFNIILVHKATM
jgi:hypothetical protein